MRFRTSAAVVAVSGLILPVSAAMADFSTGFESPYTIGALPGQQGWTSNPDAAHYNIANVSTAHPQSGANAFTFSDDPGTDSGFPYGPQVISPGTNTGSSSTISNFSFDISGVMPGTTAAARHDIYLVSNAATDVDPKFGFNDYVGGISLQSDGRVLAEAYTPDFGGYMSLTETGVSWTPNTYHTVTISVNAATSAMTYTYDGLLLLTTTAFYETSVGNMVFLDDLRTAAGETANYDNISVVAPEPATLSLVAIGCVLLGRRRTRRAVSI